MIADIVAATFCLSAGALPGVAFFFPGPLPLNAFFFDLLLDAEVAVIGRLTPLLLPVGFVGFVIFDVFATPSFFFNPFTVSGPEGIVGTLGYMYGG